MPDFTGHSLGRYHILEQLGEGGMAVVYKAYDTRLECEVAVKFIRMERLSPELAEKTLKRFEHEAKTVAQLTQSHIVKVTDYGEYQGVPYLVMEYLPGGTLKQYTGKPMPFAQAAHLLAPVARALEYAHNQKQKIIHRDVKPSNILITQDGEPMLTDFGVAKLLEGNSGQTLTGAGIGPGTPEYMAPEQWQNQTSPQSDIYSLGVVFYELITGRVPYKADTPAALLIKQTTDPLPRPRQFVADLPAAVEKVIFKVLARRPEDRYQTMGEFAGVLERLASGKAEAGRRGRLERVELERARTQRSKVGPSQEEGNATWDEQVVGVKAAEPMVEKEQSERKKNRPIDIRRWGILALAGLLVVGMLVMGYLSLRWASSGGWKLIQTIQAYQAQRSMTKIARVEIIQATPDLTYTAAAQTEVAQMTQMGSTVPSPSTQAIPTVVITSPVTTVLSLMPSQTVEPAVQSTDLALPLIEGTLFPKPETGISSGTAKQVVELSCLGKATMQQVAFSWDGNIIGIASSIGVYLYDSPSLKQIDFFPTNKMSVNLAFSPNGKTLASGLEDHTVILWDIASGQVLHTLSGHTDVVTSIVFSKDGNILASSSNDKSVILWDASSGKRILILTGHTDVVTSLAFSPDGKILASGSGDHTIILYDMASRTNLNKIDLQSEIIDNIAFSADGSTLITALDDGNLYLWDVATGQKLRTLNWQGGAITSIALSPDGKMLASASTDKVIIIWDLSTGQRLHVLTGNQNVVISLSFSQDGKILSSFAKDDEVIQWDAFNGAEHIAKTNNYLWWPFTALTISQDANIIAIGSEVNKTVSVVDLEKNKRIQVLNNLYSISSLALSRYSKTLAIGIGGIWHNIGVWDVASGIELSWLPPEDIKDWVKSITFSPDGQTLAVGSQDKSVTLWDLGSSQVLHTISGHADAVTSVTFSPDGKKLASSSWDNAIILWDVASGQRLRTLTDHTDIVNSVVFSPNGKYMASCSRDKTIIIWDVAKGQRLRTLTGHTDDVTSVAFSPDSNLLASGSADNSVKIWDVGSGGLLNTLSGHTSTISSVAFSSDGKSLVSASMDGTIRIWGIAP